MYINVKGQKKPNWFGSLSKSLVKGHRLMDPSAWAPPNPFLLDPLFVDFWVEKIQEVQKRIKERKISFDLVANTIMGPGCIRKEFRWIIWGGRLMGLPVEKVLDLMIFYKKILDVRAGDDPFNLHSAYWHPQNEIEVITKNTKWIAVTDESKRIISQLSANCPPVAWGLFTDFFYHRAYEAYGLYKKIDLYNKLFAPNDVLMIRQYGPFYAPELWSHTKDFFKYKIVVKTVYDDLNCDFDYINHFTTTDNIPAKLKYWDVEIDGKSVTEIKELRNINEKIIEMAMLQDTFLKQLGSEGQKRFTIRAKYYALKELFELVDLPWEPEEEVLNRVKNKDLLRIKFPKIINEEEKNIFWSEIFDLFAPFVRKELLDASKQVKERINI